MGKSIMDNNDKTPEIIREILNARTPAPVQESEGEERIHAAVLMPLFLDNGAYHLIFTKRADSVESHKGQISFPGGLVDDKDESFLDTALREADEEIGLLKEDIAVLGRIDDIQTKSTNFIVHSFVGVIPPSYDFRINPDEVEKIIRVPLSVFFSDDPRYKKEEAEFQGVIYPGTAWQYRSDVIWGATARIMINFIDNLGGRLSLPRDPL